MNDDLTLLASAYLDGDVTAHERAVVEADPALLAEVERLRSIRVLLSDVEPSSISRREAQLAAALATWDRLPAAERTGAAGHGTPRSIERGADPALVAAAGAVTAPTPMSNRRRPNNSRRLLGAAAAIVLVLAGGIAARTITGGTSDDTSSSGAATSTPEILASTDEAQTSPNVESLDAPAVGGDAAELDTGTADVAPPGDDALEELNTIEELGIFASDAVNAPRAPDVPAATSAAVDGEFGEGADVPEWPLCLGVDFIVGPAQYQGIAVLVGFDESRNLAIAYTVPDCREVARALLP